MTWSTAKSQPAVYQSQSPAAQRQPSQRPPLTAHAAAAARLDTHAQQQLLAAAVGAELGEVLQSAVGQRNGRRQRLDGTCGLDGNGYSDQVDWQELVQGGWVHVGSYRPAQCCIGSVGGGGGGSGGDRG